VEKKKFADALEVWGDKGLRKRKKKVFHVQAGSGRGKKTKKTGGWQKSRGRGIRKEETHFQKKGFVDKKRKKQVGM